MRRSHRQTEMHQGDAQTGVALDQRERLHGGEAEIASHIAGREIGEAAAAVHGARELRVALKVFEVSRAGAAGDDAADGIVLRRASKSRRVSSALRATASDPSKRLRLRTVARCSGRCSGEELVRVEAQSENERQPAANAPRIVHQQQPRAAGGVHPEVALRQQVAQIGGSFDVLSDPGMG